MGWSKPHIYRDGDGWCVRWPMTPSGHVQVSGPFFAFRAAADVAAAWRQP